MRDEANQNSSCQTGENWPNVEKGEEAVRSGCQFCRSAHDKGLYSGYVKRRNSVKHEFRSELSCEML